MSPPHPHVDPLLRATARRLAQRRTARGAGIGWAIGATLATVAIPLRLLGLVSAPTAVAGALSLIALAVGLGALLGWGRGRLTDRELALVVDRTLDSDESVLTGVDRLARGQALPEPLARQLEGLAARRGELLAGLPLRRPQAGRWALAASAVAILGATLTPARLAHLGQPHAEPAPMVAEGQRLQQRLAELEGREGDAPDEATLPEGLRRDVADLARDLQGDELSPDEAVDRLEELEEQLDAFRDQLQPSSQLLDDLEDAARELDSEATDALAESLAKGDLDGAADAAGDLADQLSQATPDEQREAAEALEDAGRRLQQSTDEGLRQAGEAMEQTGQQLGERAQGDQQGEASESSSPSGQGGQEGQRQGEGSQGQQGQGQQSPAQGGQAGSGDLAEALRQQRQLAERLQRDKQKLEQAQQMQGAVRGAQQRMEGEGGGEGEGEGGNVAVAADGQGAGAGAGAGEGHTWEDQGEYDAEQGFSDGSAKTEAGSDASRGEAIDDFEKFYAPLRVDDPDVLLASEEGQLDEDGRIDTLVTRLTEGDEAATLPTVQLPTDYREAAAEAIEAERIPPAYREAVKTYFDDMQ